jgi:hypothetical protein
MEHRYRLVNLSLRRVKILDVINRKICCGALIVEKSVLDPGDTAEIDLTLVVGEKIGTVTHEAEVITDLPSAGSIVLRTSAFAFPGFRIEEISGPVGAAHFERSSPFRVE